MSAEGWAAIAAGFAAVAAGMQWFVAQREYSRGVRNDIRDGLAVMTSTEVAAARDAVGGAAFRPPRRESERAALRQHLFLLLWSVQRAGAAMTRSREGRVTGREAVLLYQHIDLVVEAVNEVLESGLCLGNFSDSARLTNQTLALMPSIEPTREAPQVRLAGAR